MDAPDVPSDLPYMIGNAEEAIPMPAPSTPQAALLCLRPPSRGASSGARAAPQSSGADAVQALASDGTEWFSL